MYVNDVDAVIERAVKLGATLKRPAPDQFYGERDGFIVDPFGAVLATMAELNRRLAREICIAVRRDRPV